VSKARLLLAALLLGLPLLALAGLLLLFNPDALRPRAEQAAARALGLPVRIAEPLRWRPGLVPGLEARAVSVQGADGAPVLTLGRAAAEVALWPLLSGRVVVARLALEEGALRADPAAWMPPPRPSPPGAIAAPRATPPPEFELRDARLRNWRIATPAGEVTLAEARLAARLPAGPVTLAGEAAFRGLPFAFSAEAPAPAGPWTARLAGGGAEARATVAETAGRRSFEASLEARDLAPLAPLLGRVPPLTEVALTARGPLGPGAIALDGRLAWAGLPVRLGGTADPAGPFALRAEAAGGTITAGGRWPAEVTLAADLPALAPFAPVLGRPLPALTDVTLRARATDVTAEGFALPEFALSSSAGDLSGAITLRFGARPAVSGRVESRALDLSVLRPPRAPAPTPPPAPVAPAAPGPEQLIPDLPLDLAALRGFDADLAFAFGRVTDGALDLRDLAGRFVNADGRAMLDPLGVTLAGGRLALRAAADATRAPPALHVAGQGEGIDLAALLGALGGSAPTGGRADLDLDLRGQGATTRAFAATLTGHLGLAVIEGRLGGTLARTLGQLSPALAQGVPLACLALRAEATQGLVRFTALYLEGAAGRLAGEGTLRLADEALALRLLTDLRVAGLRVRAPVPLRGTLANPRLEGQALLEGALQGRPPELPDCATTLAQARGGREGPQPAPLPPPRDAPDPRALLRGLLGR
jgi:hypothetical protein